MCATCDEQSGCKKVVSITEDRKNAVEVRSLKDPRGFSQLSNVSNMSESSPFRLVYSRRKFHGSCIALTKYQKIPPIRLVYGRRKFHGNSIALTKYQKIPQIRLVYSRRKFQGTFIAVSEKAQKKTYHGVDPQNPAKSREIRRASQINHEAGCSGKCFVHKIHDSGEASKGISQSKEMDSVNDSCSSSKVNLEPISVSIRTEVDSSGECSSSCAMIMEDRGIEIISAKELCISVLKSAGMLGARPKRNSNPVEDGDRSCLRPCKICGKSEATSKMVICDNCEEAFHVGCCNAHVKKILDEWFCSSCLKMKRNVLNGIRAIKTLHISREQGRCDSSSHQNELDYIAMMLEDNKPYRSSVRAGKGFQADIPDWLGLANYNIDAISEPLKIDTSECLSLQKRNSTKSSRFSAIGNWLQCRETIDGVGGASGTICGKWRRAPLSEVQTDNWECFCSFLWDPAHADCKVPQELETDQVLKQLKYIEMLRPRLAAKKRKMDSMARVTPRC